MAVVAVLMAQADIQEELVRILKEANWIARMGKVPPREHGEVELFIVVVAELEHQHRKEIIIHRERMERQILAVEPGGVDIVNLLAHFHHLAVLALYLCIYTKNIERGTICQFIKTMQL